MVSIGSNFQQKTNYQNKNQQKLGFGRALSEQEMEVYAPKYMEAEKLAGRNNKALILPDFSCPEQDGKNTGLGSLNSEAALKYVKFNKALLGINVVQALPRGPISPDDISPFNSSPFEFGDHLTDLNKLATPEYGSILNQETIEGVVNSNKNTPSDKANYKNIIGDQGKQAAALREAYESFKALPEDHELKKEYRENFLPNNPFVERYALFDALSEKHGTQDWTKWGDKLDQNLFNYDDTKETPKANKKRQAEIASQYKDTMDFYKFRQFIGSKQHLETKQNLNNEGIKLFGDCLIGFSNKDVWAYRPAFDESAKNPWGAPCLNFEDIRNHGINCPAGRLQKQKFDVFLANYDGARIDAGHQLSHPTVNGQGKDYGQDLINILRKSVEDTNIQRKKDNKKEVSKEDINFELLGGNADAEPLTKNEFAHILITRYAKDGYGRLKWFVENKGYQPKGYTVGVGCHDDIATDDLYSGKRENDEWLGKKPPNTEERDQDVNWLSKDFGTINNLQQYKDAKLAEIHTARNMFVTAQEAIGDPRRINIPDNLSTSNNTKNCWDARLKPNYEETYFENLSKEEGKRRGLNAPKVLAMAIRSKIKDGQLNGNNEKTKETLSFLDQATKILEQKGPNTIAAATKLAQENPSALGETLVEIKKKINNPAPIAPTVAEAPKPVVKPVEIETKSEVQETASVETISASESTDDAKMVSIPVTIHGGFKGWKVSEEQAKFFNKHGFKTTRNKDGSADIQLAIPVAKDSKETEVNFIVKKGDKYISDLREEHVKI